LPDSHERQGAPQEKIGGEAVQVIAQSHAGGALPESVRERLELSTGHSFAHIAVHDDPAAHRAADLLGARAFTLGRDIYFGREQYAPGSTEGVRLLAHEAAHTLQQNRAAIAPATSIEVGAPSDRLEREADQFASAVMAGVPAPPLSSTNMAGSVQRAVGFTHGNHSLAMTPLEARDVSYELRIPGSVGPLGKVVPAPVGEWIVISAGEQGSFIEWEADVTAHGAAGDPFGNYEAGFLQALRGASFSVVWGDGTPYDAQLSGMVPTPIRDAWSEEDIWYVSFSLRPPFGADGDVRRPRLKDSGGQQVPLNNPLHPGKTHVGKFSYSAQFTSYLGVRDTSMAVEKPAFQILAHVDWEHGVSGEWDELRPPGSRVRLTGQASLNRSAVINGDSTAVPAIIGGPVANAAYKAPVSPAGEGSPD
jgi:hypothetical protein